MGLAVVEQPAGDEVREAERAALLIEADAHDLVAGGKVSVMGAEWPWYSGVEGLVRAR
ncbi:hypothetical protein [Archangium violaceum]|uniref:hypothetical protein n=1 Tax=Archangium violaceum TaxID=83451 RepID=UPI001EF0C0C2|nr:hypothetical protein [Archangium violaceum]